jgi:hypothetical protein
MVHSLPVQSSRRARLVATVSRAWMSLVGEVVIASRSWMGMVVVSAALERVARRRRDDRRADRRSMVSLGVMGEFWAVVSSGCYLFSVADVGLC